jgi:hypothetical protein
MKTGVSYMGHHNPKHMETDLREMKDLAINDVLLAAQENDFAYFPGKLRYASEIANDLGLRPVAIFWGVLNLFGGGRSSQFLLEHPEGLQVGIDGSHRSAGCYVNPVCIKQIQYMVDIIAEHGFRGYFLDEPTPLHDCYCPSCCRRYQDWFGGNLVSATEEKRNLFRQRCAVEYVSTISNYCKTHHPALETMTCLMPRDRSIWEKTAGIESLDNLGTDIYWVNNDNNVEDMVPLLHQMKEICTASKKLHHEWLQCWGVRKGREHRILEQGKVLVREQPDTLYVWAWKGQIGTSESCDDPEKAWHYACDIIQRAKENG